MEKEQEKILGFLIAHCSDQLSSILLSPDPSLHYLSFSTLRSYWIPILHLLIRFIINRIHICPNSMMAPFELRTTFTSSNLNIIGMQVRKIICMFGSISVVLLLNFLRHFQALVE
ncbi:hypothetical protein POM88_043699 [Heracleum sosnowskyi]|uniref:Uncharacterized protein n=1 Tax=Heracleum sosnowskyi TaxID=360622 RepID=A0AAD8H1H2_9APIA|nr:hypothetical protein POM88_043699 [Heracleum sosnowskyi]